MLCESCGENEAKFHYTKIINGRVEENIYVKNVLHLVMILTLIILFQWVNYLQG